MFLSHNPHINNRLACLVRELLELPYLRVVFSVFAAVGVDVIEPFYCMTIDNQSTHSILKELYTLLHSDLGKVADDKFFALEGSVFESVSQEVFEGVAASYRESVIGAIREAAGENMADAVSLLNICLPELQTVLARQRRDYGLSEEFPAEFPVFQQAANIDDTPFNNLAMERQCGTVDYRLKKLQTLPAVSRSMALATAKKLREGRESEFRSFKLQVARKQDVELEWKERTREKFAEGAGERQLVAQAKERKRLDLLDLLTSRRTWTGRGWGEGEAAVDEEGAAVRQGELHHSAQRGSSVPDPGDSPQQQEAGQDRQGVRGLPDDLSG